MRKLLFVAAIASTTVVAAATLSPALAASLNNNIAVGHGTFTRPSPNISGVAASNQVFTPNVAHGPKLKPAVKKWVCGPIVNYDGSPHCHWVSH